MPNVKLGDFMTNEYYVYTYTDPRNGNVFYVGKGKKYRDTEHLRAVKNNWISREPNMVKWNYIKSILDDGFEPIIKRVQDCLSEHDALCVEHDLIHTYKRTMDGGTLLNIFNGSVRDELSRKSISESLKRYYSSNAGHMKGKVTSKEVREKQSISRMKFFAKGGRSTNGLNINWITPFGTFVSYQDSKILEVGLTFKQVQKRCQERCDLVITKTAAVGIKDFDAFPFVGKTWRELGWYTQIRL